MIGSTNEATRKKWIKETLEALPAGLKILDAGAGELANKVYCKHLNYISQDFCQYEGAGDGKGLQTGSWDTKQIDIISDITSIPEKDESFDIVLCTEVLEHLPDPVKALVEFHRLLKKGGKLIITAPFCSLTHFAPYHYSSGFNRYFYEFHLDNLGFKLNEVITNGNFFEYIGQEIHRIPSIANKYSSKKVSRFERFAMKIVLNMLERFSKNDTNSDELLCFGYHVIATKIN
jgi:ubiquinone/menaquinone biosynthesis C-methylase UbiE